MARGACPVRERHSGNKITTEGDPCKFDVVPIPNDKIHRDIERILHVMGKGDVRREGKGKQPAAVVVRFCPDMPPKTLIVNKTAL